MKKRILINGNKIHNRDELHTVLKVQFNLPDSYGNNLDALWDSLSHSKSIVKITVLHADKMNEYLGDYANSLINLFKDLQEKNSIELIIYPKGRKHETK